MDAGLPTSRRIAGLDEVAAAEWNALELGGVPFLRHEFLAAQERAGCVGPGTGWEPAHVIVREGARLVGALPLYAKTHSWGEFVFDFGWAQAYARHGLRYYPKLVTATPFTPATGPRFLVHPDADAGAVRTVLLAGLQEARAELGASSVHVQFATDADADWLAGREFLPRIDCQFHWSNHGYADFDAFLASFTAEKRKKAKRERRRVFEAGIAFEWRAGSELSAAEWRHVHGLHAQTFRRHGHEPYLNLAFFQAVSRTPACEPHVLLARAGREVVATAIFFRGRDTLYGRYWGAAGDFHSLHFETCYHQGIEYCIREGLARFEPGTQGEHKIARGFAPTLTRSVHWIADPRFARAIARFLDDERAAIRAYADAAADHVPYRREMRDSLDLGDEVPPAP
ncbi:MAG: GNAT family N-acetyltransferase [Steroidobacteraceae bacterium]|jgi:predicted N-acyltransferase|nr:GNAT family N-acetyltransferase [Steroidobacteraceae bacterium]